MPQAHDFWRVLKEEVADVQWWRLSAARDQFVGNVGAFLEAKVRRGLVMAQLEPTDVDKFMKQLRKFLEKTSTDWGTAGLEDHATYFQEMADELEQIAKEFNWFNQNKLVWEN